VLQRLSAQPGVLHRASAPGCACCAPWAPARTPSSASRSAQEVCPAGPV